MEWTDLKEGDILEYNPEFLQAYKAKFAREFWESYSSIKPFLDIFFVVASFNSTQQIDKSWSLRFKRTKDGEQPPSHGIIPDTGAFFGMSNGPPIFRIVSLSGDDD